MARLFGKDVNRRQFLKHSAAVGATAAGASFLPLRRAAYAQGKPITVGTMPGPRWEGALKASAAAYQAKTGKAINLVVNPFTEHYQKIATLASDRFRATSTCLSSTRL